MHIQKIDNDLEDVSPPDMNGFLKDLRKHARFASIAGKIPTLVSITNEVFPGTTSMEIEEDPEIPGRRSVVVRVDAKPPLQEVSARRKQWRNITYRLLGEDCELVQLSVTVVE